MEFQVLAIIKTQWGIALHYSWTANHVWEDNILPGKGFGQYNIKKLEEIPNVIKDILSEF